MSPQSVNTRQATRQVRDVVFVDGVRTPFGKAGDKGIYHGTRADDLVVKCIRDLMRRNPSLPAERIDEVAIAATTQTGDQGLTIGRTAALLAGLPQSVPGFAIDRMCAGAMTAVTTTARIHRLRRLRRGHRRRRGAHGQPPDGCRRGPQPALPLRTHRGPRGPEHGQHRGEPARPLPGHHQGTGRPLRRRLPGEARRRLPRRADPAGPGPRRGPPPRGGLEAAHRRRAAAPRHHAGLAGRAAHPLPRPRPRHRRQRRGPERRRHRGDPGQRRRRRGTRPAGEDAPGLLRLRRGRAAGHGHRPGPVHREGAGPGRAWASRTSGCSRSTRPSPSRCSPSWTTSASTRRTTA